jgi:hypothetical protein
LLHATNMVQAANEYKRNVVLITDW